MICYISKKLRETKHSVPTVFNITTIQSNKIHFKSIIYTIFQILNNNDIHNKHSA